MKASKIQGLANSEAWCWPGHHAALGLSRDRGLEVEKKRGTQMPESPGCRGTMRSSVGDDDMEMAGRVFYKCVGKCTDGQREMQPYHLILNLHGA